jgi:hypothetical protein
MAKQFSNDQEKQMQSCVSNGDIINPSLIIQPNVHCLAGFEPVLHAA